MVMCLGRLTNKGSQFISTTTDPKAIEKYRSSGQRLVSFDTDDVVPDSHGNKKILNQVC